MSRSYARGFPWAQIAGTIGLGSIGVALSPGCTGEEPLPSAAYGGDASVGSGFSGPPGPCTAGSTRKCGVTLGVNNGRASCFEGVNECIDGRWSECRNGTEAERPMPPEPGAGSARILSYSQATACANNPCDPQCQQWIEVPDGGLNVQYEGSFPTVPDGGKTFPWNQGPLSGYPTSPGRNQPCTVASDCQMNTHCVSPSAGTCAHSQCATGAALASGCNACVTTICGVLGTCCSGSWTQQCVDAVATECGATCTAGVNSGDPPRTEGTCEPWYPNETDPTCAGVDLAIGPTCTGGIPVCNHGQGFAPAGAKVTVYPGSQFKQSSPTGQTSTCTVPYWIAPGWCRVVPGCTVAPGDALVVSMPNAADGGAGAECTTDDNWSLYNAGSCSDPICSSNASAPETTTVNLFFMVDQTSGNPARWAAISNALKTFLSDQDSAGVHVAFRLFPDAGTTGCAGTACSVATCSTPAVEGDLDFPVGTGSPCSASPDPTECSIFAALNGLTPSGNNTPTSAALAGAVAWAKQGKAARPNEEFAVVFMTDGEPTSCDTNVTNIAAIAADGLTKGVRTYVVGVEGLSNATCQQIATAGGGAGQCFRVLSSNGNTTAQTVTALRSIANGSLSCTLDLANQGTFDPSGASVNYTAGTTPTVTPACRPDQSEYGGHCYYKLSVDTTWSDAESFCRSFGTGWHLASIGDSAENTFMTTFVGANRAWLSGEDGAIEGTWSWADGSSFPAVTSTAPYANWTSGQPSGGTAENCAYFNGLNVPAGTWNDIDCPGATYDIQAVCEGPKQGDTSVTTCPSGQVTGPGNLCYLVDNTTRTWAQALANCQALGMDLLTVTSSQQDLFVAKELTSDAWINLSNNGGTWQRGDGTNIYTTSSTTCGPGETMDGSRCYKVSTSGTWSAARTACQAVGSQFDLTKIESSAENGVVQTLTAGTDSWISGNDTATEGTWRWSDNAQFFSGRGCRSDETAVNGVCYHVETATPATWANAKTACSSASRGGKLVEIGSAAKNADVTSVLGGATNAWIGATDSGTEGKWLWDSTGTWFWTGTGVSGCPAGTKTYNGHCYTNNGGGSLRWSNARTACDGLTLGSLTWKLTTISSDAENAWVFSNFTPVFWIGATRNLCGGGCTAAERWSATWAYWVDGTPWSYTHWDTSPSQPDTYTGCVSPPSTLEVVAQMQTDGFWNDDCDDNNNAFPYVCEAQAPSPIGQYVNWSQAAPVQPDAAATADDCAVIASDGTWSDVDCSSQTRPYVCEVTQGTVVGGAYNNWATNEPSSDTSGTEDCGVISSSTGTWSDLACTTPTRPGICEGPLHSGPIGNNYNQWATSEPSVAGERARLVGTGAQKGRWAGTGATATYASVCVGSPVATTYPGVLTPVANAAACTTSGQFYYDDATDPATLTLCPKACTAVQSDGHGKLNVEVECKKTTTIPTPPYSPRPLTKTFTEDYNPACGQDRTPVWQFLTYETSAPGSSEVDFDVRVANDATSLASAPWKTVATASSTTSNEVCGLTDPCLVDLFAQLGTPDNNAFFLELRITLRPTATGDTPEVVDWRITHTCKDNQ
jgi:hypothetical protein